MSGVVWVVQHVRLLVSAVCLDDGVSRVGCATGYTRDPSLLSPNSLGCCFVVLFLPYASYLTLRLFTYVCTC